MLVIEYESGAYEPLAAASTINEARELAASDMNVRMRRLERGEEPECPACYKLWAQGVDGRYLVVSVALDATTIKSAHPGTTYSLSLERRVTIPE